ncbi:MAG TPA: S8/S53 family peptidase [Candidatus Thermoplasmatota archaeon]|nr:S8/S53 family peptidase [Candidatus Thermoplasmatota archaeon]
MRIASALALAAAFIAAAFAGCIGTNDAPSQDPVDPATTDAAKPRVVIAVIDTGMNLFHEEYRRAGFEPPAYLPADATVVRLDFDAADFEPAVAKNRAALDALEAKKLYTFPGTKVVGAISFRSEKLDGWPLILDKPKSYTHGTMTTSRAAGNTIAIGGADDVDLVIVQGFSPEAVAWAADQPWIDIISISAGISPYSIVPLVPNLLDNGGIEAYVKASHAKPFFASTGNGVGNMGLLGFPSWLRGTSGVPDAISVGANDNDKMSHWHNQDPYISADGCDNPAASASSTAKIADTGGGTSSATPFSAGGGAKMLLEARRILGHTAVGAVVDSTLTLPSGAWDSLRKADESVVLARADGNATLPAAGPLADGVFTLREFKDVLYHTALAKPTNDPSDGRACGAEPAGGVVPGDAIPEDARFAWQGYGEVNHLSIEAAVKVLAGESELPKRPGADREYARVHAIKSGVVTGPLADVPAPLALQ